MGPLPVVLFLHGTGESGTDNEKQVNSNADILYRLTDTYYQDHPAIIIAPQSPTVGTAGWGNEQMTKSLWALVNSVQQEFNTDLSRLYVMGLSMGGWGTWGLLEHYADKIAAAATFSGWSNDPKTQASLNKDIPVWIFHGDADTTIVPAHSRNVFNELKAVGNTKVKYTEFPGVGHSSWVNAYTYTDPNDGNTNLVDWLFAQTKPTYNITTTTSSVYGTVTANTYSSIAGETIGLTVTPASGYKLTLNSLKVGGGAIELKSIGNNVFTFVMPAEDVTVAASFESASASVPYNVNVAGPSANGSVASDKATAQTDDTVTLSVYSATNYKLKTLTVSPNGFGMKVALTPAGSNQFTFKMPAGNVNITAEFEIIYQVLYAETFDASTSVGGGAWAGDTAAIVARPGGTAGDKVVEITQGTGKNLYQLPELSYQSGVDYTFEYDFRGDNSIGGNSFYFNDSQMVFDDNGSATAGSMNLYAYNNWTKRTYTKYEWHHFKLQFKHDGVKWYFNIFIDNVLRADGAVYSVTALGNQSVMLKNGNKSVPGGKAYYDNFFLYRGQKEPVTGITVSGAGGKSSVKTGNTLQMSSAVVPNAATNPSVTWSVVNGTGNATIDTNGLLTGGSVGQVTVRATSQDGSGVVGSLVVTISGLETFILPTPAQGTTTMIYLDVQTSFPQVNWQTLDRLYIPAGNYTQFQVGNLPQRSASEPLIITNYGGQVKIAGTGTPYGVKIRGGSNWIFTGKYDPVLRTGDVNYPGHLNGNYTNSSGDYGIEIKNGAGHGIEVINAATPMYAVQNNVTNYEISFIEIANTGFAGIALKTDGASNIVDGVKVHDMYIHDVEAEGMYIGYTLAATGQNKFTNLEVYNNRVLRTGAEGIQLVNMGNGVNVHHNTVVMTAMDWKDPFQANQEGNLQYYQRDGSASIHDNIFIGGGEIMFNYKTYKATTDVLNSNDEVHVYNNYFAHARSYFGFIGEDTTNQTTKLRFENNVIRKISFSWNEEVHPTATDRNILFYTSANTANPLIFNNNTRDGSQKFIDVLTGNNGTTSHVSASGNTTVATIAPVQFRDPNLPADFDWLLVERWANVSVDKAWPGIAINFQYGDYVYQNGKDYAYQNGNWYKNIQAGTHTGKNPLTSPETWQLQTPMTDDFRLHSSSPYQSMGLFAGQESAQMNTSLSGPVSVLANQEFKTTYSLSNVANSVYGNIYAQQVSLAFDPNLVEFVSATPIKPGLSLVTNTDTPGLVKLVAVSPGVAITSDGGVVELTWKAKAVTATQNASISVTKAKLSDGQGRESDANLSTYSISLVYVDKTALHTKISQAQAAYNAAVEGTGLGQYPTGSKATLLAAIQAAQLVAANGQATQVTTDDALTALSSALQTFQRAVITSIKGDVVGNDGLITIGDLGLVAANYGAELGQANWNLVKNADMDGDNKIGLYDLATLARKVLE
ncbi:InlB B-repeat-containing protein [Paenibacillus qinlingensis]|uniref:Esterase n=1 Tax=Paenibacillus qinlingensis TaxID=1837343 RepID=A0ABU1P531_9BACL|nr:cohesin domain-containing protein [Paenibacillus qinlingensis]MDR6554862.1 putative esterase [Paenibacillus qinlingensis]